jgi:hypothetical protein
MKIMGFPKLSIIEKAGYHCRRWRSHRRCWRT